MPKEFNPNKFNQDDKDWIEAVDNDFDNLITGWIRDYENGSLLKEE